MNIENIESENRNKISPTLRELPSVEKLASSTTNEKLSVIHPVRTLLAKQIIERTRVTIRQGQSAPAESELESEFLSRCQLLFSQSIRRVLNATGVILHTNLGRAPLSKKWLEEMAEELSGYSTLEWDKDRGERGERGKHLEWLLKLLTGAEAALVVNNNAAALFLILHTLTKGRKVVLSRGELVQIGGGFRIPEILESTGAILVEVGTMNMTNIKDYERAIESVEKPAMVLKVHHSNFAILGHTETVAISDLVALTTQHAVACVEDLGSGALWDEGVGEPLVSQRVRSGLDLVCFSGDKMLGGPQAGIIVGKRAYIDKIRKSSLYRALRIGKVDLFLLEKTLLSYIQGEATPTQILIRQSLSDLEKRANYLKERLSAKMRIEIQKGTSSVGGGTTPNLQIPTVLLEVVGEDLKSLAKKLLGEDPAIVPRRENGRLLFDLRTIFPDDDKILGDTLLSVMRK